MRQKQRMELVSAVCLSPDQPPTDFTPFHAFAFSFSFSFLDFVNNSLRIPKCLFEYTHEWLFIL